MVYTICIEGSHENRLKKVSAAIVGKLYVRSPEMCYNPIGRGDRKLKCVAQPYEMEVLRKVG